MSLKENINEAKISGSLLKMFNSYAEQTIPEHAGEAQIKDVKRAFYAGSLSALQILDIAAQSEISDEEGAMFVKKITEEIHTFFNRVAEGSE